VLWVPTLLLGCTAAAANSCWHSTLFDHLKLLLMIMFVLNGYGRLLSPLSANSLECPSSSAWSRTLRLIASAIARLVDPDNQQAAALDRRSGPLVMGVRVKNQEAEVCNNRAVH
jgi:hypothetical protein